jgi:hypothetical protein
MTIIDRLTQRFGPLTEDNCHEVIGQLTQKEKEELERELGEQHKLMRSNVVDRPCIDCGTDTTDEYYMVKDDVWSIGEHDGLLCIGCLERRIERQLTPTDFIDCPLNWEGPKSDRIRSRLGHAIYLRATSRRLIAEANRGMTVPKAWRVPPERIEKLKALEVLWRNIDWEEELLGHG